MNAIGQEKHLSSTHLDFYTEHGISPVHYLATDMREHFERRASLYRGLGVPPLAFRGARVLEVAAGSGQNSLYVASLMPQSLALVEPNPAGMREIGNLYRNTDIPHVSPELVDATLQAYNPEQRFDIVICENWLGNVPTERALLRKLAGMLDHHGIMVITTVTPTGLLPNLIRRALAVKYCDPRLPFDQRTRRLVEMFEPHLGTMRAMTRSAVDWVHDNMMNPAYFDLCLTIPSALRELGGTVTALGTNPSFGTDWRWFKALHGPARNFNQHVIDEYESALHNFLDYQALFAQPDVGLNKALELACVEFLETVRAYESTVTADAKNRVAFANVTAALDRIVRLLADFPDPVKSGVAAGLSLLLAGDEDHRTVARPGAFSRLFGRETVYLSLTREA